MSSQGSNEGGFRKGRGGRTSGGLARGVFAQEWEAKELAEALAGSEGAWEGAMCSLVARGVPRGGQAGRGVGIRSK